MKLKSLLKEAAGDIFSAMNKLKYRELSSSGSPKMAAALDLMAKKIAKRTGDKDDGLEYASGVYHGAIKSSYDFKYSSNAYDEQYQNTSSEFEKDVDTIQKILRTEFIQGQKKPVREAMDSLASYYNQAGKIGAGEYNLRNVLEEIDDILMGLDKTTRYELTTVISDAIDMAYEMGMDEGIEQSK